MIEGGFVTVVGSMYSQAVGELLPWLLAMTMVVVVDLLTGLRKVWLMKVHTLRWSKGIRTTMSKLVTYWAFAVGAVLINVASGGEYAISKWACLLVCAIEGCSIVSNILKPYGIDISIQGILHAIGSKTNIDLDDVVKPCDGKKRKQ